MKLKFSPFFLFLILLIVLVISFFLGRNNLGSEGFLSKDGISAYAKTDIVVLEKYSQNNLRFINDQILFDPKNGNLIEIGTSSGKSQAEIPIKEASIGYIFVSKRSGGSNNGYTLTSPDVEIPESKIETIPVSYSQFLYNTKLSENNDVYVYISWEKDTYLYIDSPVLTNGITTGMKPTTSFYFNAQQPQENPAQSEYKNVDELIFTGNSTYIADLNDNTIVTTVPSPIVSVTGPINAYQLCTDLYYYPKNGCILDTNLENLHKREQDFAKNIEDDIDKLIVKVPDTRTEAVTDAYINELKQHASLIINNINNLEEIVTESRAHYVRDFPILTAFKTELEKLSNYAIPTAIPTYEALKNIVNKQNLTDLKTKSNDIRKEIPYKPIVYNNNGEKLTKDTDISALFSSSGPAVTEFTTFTSWTKVINKKRVVYMGIGKKRAILVMGLKDQRYDILNCVRYDVSGNKVVAPETPVTVVQPTLDMTGNTVASSSSAGTGSSGDSNYWRNYWFDQTLNGEYTNEYILKTQVIPPVCPSCPSCPGTGACNTCGGAGGSGTQVGNVNGSGSAAGVGANANYTDMTNGTFKSNADANTIGGATTLQTMAAGNTIQGVVQTGGNTVTGVVGQGVDLAKSTGSGAVDLAKSAGSGAVDLAKSAGSGAVDLLKSAGGAIAGGVGAVGSGIGAVGSGIGNMIGDVSRGGYYNSYGGPAYSAGPNQSVPASTMGNYGPSTYGGVPTTQSGVPGVDNLSYYGALSSTEANFKPITADFSRFGR